MEFRKNCLKIAKSGQKGRDLDNLTYFSNLGKSLNISGMAKGINFKFGVEIDFRKYCLKIAKLAQN